MKASGFLSFGTDLKNPDFAKMATAIGVYAKRLENDENLELALAEFLAHPGPGLLDVVVNSVELIIPPTLKAEQVKCFSL